MEKINLEVLINGNVYELPEFVNYKNIVYCCENLVNGKVYVGETKRTLRERWMCHKYAIQNHKNKKINMAIYDAIIKYGMNNFSISILEKDFENDKERQEREKYWISKLNSFVDSENSNGYNMTTGGRINNSSCKEKSKRVKETCLKRYGCLPIEKDVVRKKALETNRKNHGGILAFQQEKYRKKGMDTQIERYGMLAIHLPENKEKAKEAMKRYKEEHGTLPFNTKESIKKAQKSAPLYRMIGCINRHLKILEDKNIEITSRNYVFETNDVKHMWQQHIPHVLNRIGELRKISKWNENMEKIFSNIEYDKEQKGIKKIIFKE